MPAASAPMAARYLVSVLAGLAGSFVLFTTSLWALDHTGHLPPPAFANSLCADEKLAFLRNHPVAAPNLLVVGSSVAWRHFDGETVAAQLPGTRPLNGAFCGLRANQAVYVAGWLLGREPSVRQVLMIVDPQDFAGCGAVPTAVFNRQDADAYVYGNGSRWLPYARYFSPLSLLRNALSVKAQRADLIEFDPLVFDRYGDGPLNTPNSRGLTYAKADPLDPACFTALRQLATQLKGDGRAFTVVATPLHPQWKTAYDPHNTLAAQFDRDLRQALAATGARFWNADAGHGYGAGAFIDAIHLRWAAAKVFSQALASHLGTPTPRSVAGSIPAEAPVN
ncbi:hypothetical protein [Pseudomonas sp. NPDC007930]|uniref:hypothetical protein n=1 Tax=Pseudomonas sp. NPDC007930 TaxID=3364417 RepID=UPI0036E013BA